MTFQYFFTQMKLKMLYKTVCFKNTLRINSELKNHMETYRNSIALEINCFCCNYVLYRKLFADKNYLTFLLCLMKVVANDLWRQNLKNCFSFKTKSFCSQRENTLKVFKVPSASFRTLKIKKACVHLQSRIHNWKKLPTFHLHFLMNVFLMIRCLSLSCKPCIRRIQKLIKKKPPFSWHSSTVFTNQGKNKSKK